jgi:uncharacterized Rmd1/YagE family protein
MTDSSRDTLAEAVRRPIDKAEFRARAYYPAERIDTRGATPGLRLASRPLCVSIAGGGVAVLFRWGAVVFFDASDEQVAAFLQQLRPQIELPYEVPETEAVTVRISAQGSEGVEAGVVTLRDSDVPRLQTLANILGKTVALAQYEADVAANFDRIEPFATKLERRGQGARSMRELRRHIGRTLLNEHKLIGRVEVAEKPELLWEHPELEPLYARLEAEYDLRERAEMLDQKLELTARTVRTVLELLQHRHALRVEWYIVLLIVFEIVLSLYDMFVRR